MRLSAIAISLGVYLPLAVAVDVKLQVEDDVKLAEVSWTGIITPGGPNITLNGTVSSIYEQILHLNPDFVQEIGKENEDNSAVDENSLGSPRPLAVRAEPVDPINWDSLYCDDKAARPPLIRGVLNGITILRRMGGQCLLWNKRGERCIEVTCSYDAAIQACQYYGITRKDFAVPCSHIADNAQGILNKCTRRSVIGWDHIWDKEVAGDIVSFDKSWAVFVKRGWC